MGSKKKKGRKSAKRRPPRGAALKPEPSAAGEWFERLVELQARLRGPNGCPWDREQTHATLRTYLLEEAYEVLDALESGDDSKFREEMGDLLLQIVFHSQIAREQGRFAVSDVIREIHEKMVRRHPHVFGEKRARDAREVLKNWEQIKAEERHAKGQAEGTLDAREAGKSASLLDGVSRGLPATLEGLQLTRRAARIGFDWENVEGVLEKMQEETAEFRQALENKDQGKTEQELGDLLFAVVNLARFLHFDPEIALKKASAKFAARFREMERLAVESGRKLADVPREEMEGLWERAKNRREMESGTDNGGTKSLMSDRVLIRECQGIEEFHRCVALQREIWGEKDLEVEPATMFVVASETGGQVLGAFDGPRLVGYTLAVAGLRDRTPYLHSHMTGVHADYRNTGVGRALKLFQREEALARGIRLVEWTFDPLETRNAHFNLNRLGAICRNYLPNLYGLTTSPLHLGLPTDRLVAEWQLDSPRVVAAVAGLAREPEGAPATVELPGEIDRWKENNMPEVAKVQSRIREEFTAWFARGYAAIGVRKTATGKAYLLTPWSDF